MPGKHRSRARRRAKRLKAAEEKTRMEHEKGRMLRFTDRQLQERQMMAHRKPSETNNLRGARVVDAAVTLRNEAHHSVGGHAFPMSPIPGGSAGGGRTHFKGSGTGSVSSALLLSNPLHQEERTLPEVCGRGKGELRLSGCQGGEGGGSLSSGSTDGGVAWDACSDSYGRQASSTTNSSSGSGSSADVQQHQLEDRLTSSKATRESDASVDSTDGSGGWDGYSSGPHPGGGRTHAGSNSSNGGNEDSDTREGRIVRGSESVSVAAVVRGSWSEEDPGVGQGAAFRNSHTGCGPWENLRKAADGGYSGHVDDVGGSRSSGAECELSPPVAVVGGSQDGWTGRTMVSKITNRRQSSARIADDSGQGIFACGDHGTRAEATVGPAGGRGSTAASLKDQSKKSGGAAAARMEPIFREGIEMATLTGQSNLPASWPSQPAASMTKAVPAFGESPLSMKLKQLLGVHPPFQSPALPATGGLAAMPPGFGVGGRSIKLEGPSGVATSPLWPPAFVAMPPSFGETPPSKVLKGILGLHLPSSSQKAPAAYLMSHGSLQRPNYPLPTSATPSSARGGAEITEGPAYSGWETKAGSKVGQRSFGTGDLPSGLGHDEAGVDETPSLSSLDTAATVFTPAALAIDLGGGAAAPRPPPGFERAPRLTPIPETPTTAVRSLGQKTSGLPPPPGFDPPPQVPPSTLPMTDATLRLDANVALVLPPPGFGLAPQLPPSAATGGDDVIALPPSAGGDYPFFHPPSHFRGSGPPPGFGPLPLLRQPQAVGSAGMLLPSDFGPSPPRSSSFIDHHPNAIPGPDDVDHGRFGFIGDLASLDPRVMAFGRQLGQGGCAVVHKVEVQGTDRRDAVAEYTGGAGLVVKVVPEGGSYAQKMSMKRELRVVKQIPSDCHPNIMDIVSVSEEKLSMVMPAAAWDLRDLLDDKVVLTAMSSAERMTMMAGAARGLHYLHNELGMTHGDVKPENCLLDKGLVIKIADFGLSGFSQETIGGLTKQYAAPEAVANFQRQGVPTTATLQPSLDLYAFGVMTVQVLFMEKEPRFDGKELATKGMTPKHPSFDAAFRNSFDLHERFEETGNLEDRQRLEKANSALVDLHIDYAAQPAKMGDLRTTILDPEKWNQPQELLFQEEVDLTLLSLLNKNPHRRASLDTVATLLECPFLWSPVTAAGAQASGRADDYDNGDGDGHYSRPHLPQDVQETIDGTIAGGLLVDPALNTPSGVWWEAPEFQFPWWDYPPPVERIVL